MAGIDLDAAETNTNTVSVFERPNHQERSVFQKNSYTQKYSWEMPMAGFHHQKDQEPTPRAASGFAAADATTNIVFAYQEPKYLKHSALHEDLLSLATKKDPDFPFATLHNLAQDLHFPMYTLHTLYNLQFSSISMNMVWIYENASHQERLVFPEKPLLFGPRKVSGDYFTALHNWTHYFKPVHVWYDSQFVGPQALNNTQDELKQRNLEQSVELRNIRDLAIVRDHPTVFNEGSPIDFRCDFVREVIAYEQLLQAQQTVLPNYSVISIYSDWNRVSDAYPLDKSTLANL